MKIIIIGGVAGGASAATRIRRLDENAVITMYDKGDYVSFSNCSLPYHISKKVKDINSILLMKPETFLERYKINAIVKHEVIEINKEDKKVKVKNLETNEVFEDNYDKLIISTGAKAIIPPFKGLEKVKYHTLKTINDLERIMSDINDKSVKNISVIGGGFIGVEVAENFKEAGYNVTLIEGSKQILAPLDLEMANFLHEELIKNDINLILNKKVDSFDNNLIILNDETKIKTDLVVMAIGVRPETEFLKNSGIEISPSGHIIVNKNYQTNNKDIYAAGDAILIQNGQTNKQMPLALAGPANKQGKLIADHIYNYKIINKGYIGTSIIKVFDLNAASTGLNEKSLANLDIDYDVSYTASSDKVSIMPDANKMFFKLIFDKKTKKVLGAQAIGKGSVDKRIDVIATAIKANFNLYDLADLELSYAPPFGTGKDVINKAAYNAINIAQDFFKQVSFTKIYDLIEQNAQIIDVRDENEVQKLGQIKSSINIPFSKIRSSLDKIDKNKKVYVHCQSGQRSYNVVRILKQNGFDAYNIAGSFIYISNLNKINTKFNLKDNIIIK